MATESAEFELVVGEKLCNILREVVDLHGPEPLDLSAVTLDSNLYEEVGVDSLTAIALVVEIQRQFRVRIPDEKAETLRTLRDFLRCLETEYYKVD